MSRCYICMGSSAPAFFCHINCFLSYRAGKRQFFSSSRPRQIHHEPQRYPEFPSKYNKSSLNWCCSETRSSLQSKNFYSWPSFSIFSSFPTWYCLLSDKWQEQWGMLFLWETHVAFHAHFYSFSHPQWGFISRCALKLLSQMTGPEVDWVTFSIVLAQMN